MGIIGSSFQKLEGWMGSFTFEVFASILKKEWIDQALEKTGRATQRERKLTGVFTVWLAIAMGFYRNLSIQNVVNRMGNVLGVGSLWKDGKEPTSGSTMEARTRVGFGPLRILVEKLSQWILETHREAMSWKGWLLLDLDGTTFKVPDSDENRHRFGLPGSNRGRAAFPQMRAMFLVSARLRFILGAIFAPYGRGEIALALRMLNLIPQGTLLVLDRGFNAWQFLLEILEAGNHFLIRAKKNMKGKVLTVLGPGDCLIEIKIPRALRHSFPCMPKTVVVREITVRIKGKPYCFFTSLLDASLYPAVDLVLRYAERWQEEIAFDEIKTHQCGATTVNHPVIFRSKATRRVLQEAYGLVLAYNLIRILMTQAAIKFNVPPLRISFVDSLERIRSAALLMAAARTPLLPAIFEDLLHSIAQCVLPKRKYRENPREVCIKMSSYLCKRKKAS
jgi:hypothetical protein